MEDRKEAGRKILRVWTDWGKEEWFQVATVVDVEDRENSVKLISRGVWFSPVVLGSSDLGVKKAKTFQLIWIVFETTEALQLPLPIL